MKESVLVLSKNRQAIIDTKELQRCNFHYWYYNPANGYAYTFIDGSIVYLHSFILQTNQQVDHRNLNKLDCRKENLRLCTGSQNCQNRLKHFGSTSQYKGVHWCANRDCWYAKIFVDGRSKHLGKFDDEVKAAKAYDEAAMKHFGEFARTNFNYV